MPEAQQEELGAEALHSRQTIVELVGMDPLGRPLFARAQSLSIVPRATLLGQMHPWSQTVAGTVGLAGTGSILQSIFSVMPRR